jgi:hypothetical protein
MYTNVFYIRWFTWLISYIYKLATSSHIKPGLFEVTSLTWLLLDPRIFVSRSSPLALAPESYLHQIPALHRFLIPELCRFMTLELRRFQPSWNRQQIRVKEPDSAIFFAHYLKAWKTLKTYQDSFMNVSLSRNWCFHPEGDSRTYLTNFGKPDISRV